MSGLWARMDRWKLGRQEILKDGHVIFQRCESAGEGLEMIFPESNRVNKDATGQWTPSSISYCLLENSRQRDINMVRGGEEKEREKMKERNK